MNIGIVTTWFERGAAYVSRQIRHVLLPGNNVFIYARSGERYAKGELAWEVGNLTWGKPVPPFVTTALDLGHFRRWVQDNGLDSVLFNEQWWWEPVLLCHDLGVTCGSYVDYYTEETLPLFRNYDFLICNTRRHLSAFDWHPQALYVPWGTDTALFVPTVAESARQGTVTFFHSAGMNMGARRKGTDLVLGAFSLLRTGSARLVIHSQEDIRTEFPEWRERIDQMTRDGRLDLVVRTVPAPGLYGLGDVYVYPSRLDGIGLTVPEALASGLPAIVPNSPPMNEFVAREAGRLTSVSRLYSRRDGYYWPQCMVKAEDVAGDMEWYVKNAPELPRLKDAARLHAVQNLDWNTNASGLSDMVRSSKALPGRARDLARAQARHYERHSGQLSLRIYNRSKLLYRIARGLRGLA